MAEGQGNSDSAGNVSLLDEARRLSPAELAELRQLLAPPTIWAQGRAETRDPADHIRVRVLNGNEPVTDDADGNRLDLNNKSLFDTLNFGSTLGRSTATQLGDNVVGGAAAASKTLPVLVSAPTARIIVVSIFTGNNAVLDTSATTVEYNGSPMTQLGETSITDAGEQLYGEIWYSTAHSITAGDSIVATFSNLGRSLWMGYQVFGAVSTAAPTLHTATGAKATISTLTVGDVGTGGGIVWEFGQRSAVGSSPTVQDFSPPATDASSGVGGEAQLTQSYSIGNATVTGQANTPSSGTSTGMPWILFGISLPQNDATNGLVVSINPDNRRQVDIDFDERNMCYDAILDPFGEAVFTGGTTQGNVFSTAQAAMDYLVYQDAQSKGDVGGAGEYANTIWACPSDSRWAPESFPSNWGGDYGDFTVPGDFFVTIEAAGGESWLESTPRVVFGQVTLGSAVGGTDIAGLSLKNVWTNNIVLNCAGGAFGHWENVWSRNWSESAAAAGAGGVTIEMSFDNVQCGNINTPTSFWTDTCFSQCEIDSMIAGNADRLYFSDTMFFGHVTPTGATKSGALCLWGGEFNGVYLSNCDFFCSGTTDAGVLIKAATASAGINLNNCSIEDSTTTRYMVWEDGGAETPENVILQGWSVRSMTGSTAMRAAGGAFNNSTFGPNAPDNLSYAGVTNPDPAKPNVFYTSGLIPSGGSSGPWLRQDGTTPLTGLWDQSGAFNIVQRGGDLLLANGKSLKLYSDDSATPSTLKAAIRASDGFAAFGDGTALVATEILNAKATLTDPGSSVFGAHILPTMAMTANSSRAMTGIGVNTTVTGSTFTQSGGIIGISSTASLGTNVTNSATISGISSAISIGTAATASTTKGIVIATTLGAGSTTTDWYGIYIPVPVSGGLLTNAYGLYIENQNKGGTLNRAIYSAGGVSVHAGAIAIGSTTAPVASALTEWTSTTQGLLIPRMTTAQRNAIGSPATGLLVYNTSTNTFDYYDGSAWRRSYSLTRMVFAPDAAPQAAVGNASTTDPQGNVVHSGPDGETAFKLHVDCETAGTTLTVTVAYGDTDSLDTVASWTTIATINVTTSKSNSTTTMTNAAIPADRLVAAFFSGIAGTYKDVTVQLDTKVQTL